MERFFAGLCLTGLSLAGLAAAGCADSGPENPGPGGGPDAQADPAADASTRGTTELPFPVDDWFAASGHMGDGQNGGVSDEEVCADTRPGQARGNCHRFTWTPGDQGWGGVYWQHPAGNWGSMPGLAIAAGATEVSFHAWGQTGGEVVTFMVGMEDADGFTIEKDITLTTEPTRYAIDLQGTTYDRVAGGFGWVAADSETPVVFSVDDIAWE